MNIPSTLNHNIEPYIENFGNVCLNIPYIQLIDQFEKEKTNAIISYVALKRCKRRLKGHVNIFFTDPENQHLPSLIKLKVAIKRLEIKYWSIFINETKIKNIMSAIEYNKWKLSIENGDIPVFNIDNLVANVKEIYNSLPKYLAERIIFAFSGLSKNHLTNSGFCFGEKLIFEKVHSGLSQSKPYAFVDSEKCSALDEVRKLVLFFNKDISILQSDILEIKSSDFIDIAINELKLKGKTEFHLDNDLIYVKTYKIGTVHVGINPEIVEKMNNFLSSVLKSRIGNKKTKNSSYFYKARKIDTFYKKTFFNNKILNILSKIRTSGGNLPKNSHSIEKEHSEYILSSPTIYNDFKNLISYLGFDFLYQQEVFCILNIKDPDLFLDTIKDIIFNGLDEKNSYQQYYTNEKLSEIAYNTLIEDFLYSELDNKTFLEPSVGNGSLAKFLPKDRSTLVDISSVNSLLMRSKGFTNVLNMDFLDFKEKNNSLFDFIIMNPPYTKRQDYSHTMTAINLLKNKGTLVSIIPSSLKKKFDNLDKKIYNVTCSKDYNNEFENTNIKVFILKVSKI